MREARPASSGKGLTRKEIAAALERAKARAGVFVSTLESFAWSASPDGEYLESLAKLAFEELGEAGAKECEKIARPMLAALGVCAQRIAQSGGAAPFSIAGILDELLARGALGPSAPQGAPPERMGPQALSQWAQSSPWAALMKSPWGLEAAMALERGWRKGSGLSEGIRLGLPMEKARALAESGARREERGILEAMLASASALDADRFALALGLHPSPFGMDSRERMRDCLRCFCNPDLPGPRLAQRRQIGMGIREGERADRRWPEGALEALEAIRAKAKALGLEGLGGLEEDALDEAYLCCRGAREEAWDRLCLAIRRMGGKEPRKAARREFIGRLLRKAVRGEALGAGERRAFGEEVGLLFDSERWMEPRRELEPLACELAGAMHALDGEMAAAGRELMERWAKEGFGRQLEWRGGGTSSLGWALLLLSREASWEEAAARWLGACVSQGLDPHAKGERGGMSIAERAGKSDAMAAVLARAEALALGGEQGSGGGSGRRSRGL